MTEREKYEIVKTMADWGTQCVEGEIYPVLLIGMPAANIGELKIWRGGRYTTEQVVTLLHAIIDNIQND